MLDEIYSRKRKDGKEVINGFPEGCETCNSTIEWDCENCTWRENAWKYEEVLKVIHIYRAKQGGLDLMKLKKFNIDDFKKLALLEGYIGNL